MMKTNGKIIILLLLSVTLFTAGYFFNSCREIVPSYIVKKAESSKNLAELLSSLYDKSLDSEEYVLNATFCLFRVFPYCQLVNVPWNGDRIILEGGFSLRRSGGEWSLVQDVSKERILPSRGIVYSVNSKGVIHMNVETNTDLMYLVFFENHCIIYKPECNHLILMSK